MFKRNIITNRMTLIS